MSMALTPEQQLHIAFNNSNFEECERLLANGVDINSKVFINNIPNYTVTLFWYVRDQEMFNFLKDHEFDWNTRNNKGETSAIIACGASTFDGWRGIGPVYKGYDDIVLDLLGTDNIDWSIVSNDGSTALIMAAFSGFVDSVDYILDWGRDGILNGVDNMEAYVNIRDSYGMSAYNYMETYDEEGHFQIRKEMLEKLCDLGADDCHLKIENIGEKIITTKDPADTYTHNNIKNGNNMVNFNDEFKYGRYYTKASFNIFPKKNPYTLKKIKKAYKYKAKLAPPSAPAVPAVPTL